MCKIFLLYSIGIFILSGCSQNLPKHELSENVSKPKETHASTFIKNEPCFSFQECANYFGRTVSNNWYIPIDAHDGMQVTIKIKLKHSGELISADVYRSSGDKIFDNRAIQAIRHSAPFLGIRTLDYDIFEKNFSSFFFRFKPAEVK